MPLGQPTPAISIAPERSTDFGGIRSVLMAAFPRPAEANLVDTLRKRNKLVSSFVAHREGEVVGAVQGTAIRIDPNQPAKGVALAPMAVLPAHQRIGIGRDLVKRFLGDARARGFDFCVVLGDPAYYGRFGFVRSVDQGLRCTYDVPPEVFMVRRLRRAPLGLEACVVHYESEFDDV